MKHFGAVFGYFELDSVDFWCDGGCSPPYIKDSLFRGGFGLDSFLKMPKKRKKSTGRSTLKLGRPEELKIEDLPRRFRDMKFFLENYWGRVGLGLRKARKPDDVKSVLNLVRGIESMSPFRGHAACCHRLDSHRTR